MRLTCDARARGAGLGRLQTQAAHGFLEKLAVLRHLDGVQLGADQFHAVTLQHASLSRTGKANSEQ